MPASIDHTLKTRLLLRPVKSPLGTIHLGGVNQGGFGVGRPTFRTLKYYGIVFIMNGAGFYADRVVSQMKVGKGDMIVADKLIHACMIDGARLSGATVLRFAHNNLEPCLKVQN